MNVDAGGPLSSTARIPTLPVLVALVAATSWLLLMPAALRAQSVTTAAVRGTVVAADGTSVEGVRVSVVNAATGYMADSEVRHGRYLVQGLEAGGPYTITVERLGMLPQQRTGLILRVGEPLDVHFVMPAGAIMLDSIQAIAVSRATAHGGTATTLADSLLHRLPSLNRDLYDFVRLVPQISTQIGFPSGFSGGGVGFRFNNFLINGVPDRSVTSNASATALTGGRSLPLAAVKEYQVLLAPYDVRYGDFAGALVNTVTLAGTNVPRGTVFAYWRNERLARYRDGGSTSVAPYEQLQYGVAIGGPIVRDRLHFFIAPELQRRSAPAEGPYVGQPAELRPVAPVTAGDLARLEDILRRKGLVAGSGGPVQNESPLTNIFARLDLAVPAWRSRLAVWASHTRSLEDGFSRAARDTFPLSSYRTTTTGRPRLVSLQLHTTLRNGAHNELLVLRNLRSVVSRSAVQQPVVHVAVPSTTGGTVMISTGTHPSAQAAGARSSTVSVIDNFTLPIGDPHQLTVGVAAEHFSLGGSELRPSFGTWTFSSLDALARDEPERYELRLQPGATDPFTGAQYAAYIGDRWLAGERLSVTLGLRADVLAALERAPYNRAVDSLFGRRTDAPRHAPVLLSPRLGFSWDLFGTRRDQLRGGVGMFAGRPPASWLRAAVTSYGDGAGTLRCGGPGQGPPPAFVADYREQPTTCATGSGPTTNRDVDLLDRELTMARTLRASLAYDRRLARDVVATVEALASRNIADFVFVNLNLQGPQAVDRHGRVLYGTIAADGRGAPVPVERGFSEVIDLRNTAANHSYQLSARVEKSFSRGTAATAAYTRSRARDVQTPLRTGVRGTVNWSSRAVSGRHDDLRAGISLNDVPHRVIVAATQRAPWTRWLTEFSFYYVGESGSPFTYRAWGTQNRGDLNADGSNANDPIYVPRDVFDPDEIRFDTGDNSAAALANMRKQQEAFAQFIERTPCLREQRGRIVARNSCREPWSHTTAAAVRQAVPLAGRPLEAELAVFNVLNLLRRDWGLYRVAVPELLEHTAQLIGATHDASQPIFRFDPNATQWSTLRAVSAYQLQLGVRYRF